MYTVEIGTSKRVFLLVKSEMRYKEVDTHTVYLARVDLTDIQNRSKYLNLFFTMVSCVMHMHVLNNKQNDTLAEYSN